MYMSVQRKQYVLLAEGDVCKRVLVEEDFRWDCALVMFVRWLAAVSQAT